MPTPEELAILLQTPTAAAIRQAFLAERGLAGSYGYDATFDQAVNDLYAGQATGMSGINLGEDRLNQDFTTNNARLGENQAKELGGLKGFFADRGMSYSGANINRQSDVANLYGQRIADLTTNATRGREDFGRSRNKIYDYVRDSLAGLKGTYATKVAEEQAERDRAAAEAAAAKEAADRAAKIARDRAIKTGPHEYPNAPRNQPPRPPYPGPETAETTNDATPVYAATPPDAEYRAPVPPPYVPTPRETAETTNDANPVYSTQMSANRVGAPSSVKQGIDPGFAQGYAPPPAPRDPGFSMGQVNPMLMPSPGEPVGNIPKPSAQSLPPTDMVNLPVQPGTVKTPMGDITNNPSNIMKPTMQNLPVQPGTVKAPMEDDYMNQIKQMLYKNQLDQQQRDPGFLAGQLNQSMQGMDQMRDPGFNAAPTGPSMVPLPIPTGIKQMMNAPAGPAPVTQPSKEALAQKLRNMQMVNY